MRTRLLVLTVAIAPLVILAPSAVAIGPGGWGHLGNGGSAGVPALNGHVTALNTSNPGILYVGGSFTNAGGKPNADHLAQWNGAAWSAVSGSARLNGAVDAIAYHAGHVYVGGEFTNVGGDSNIDFLAEWTGTAWKTPCTSTGPHPPITAQVSALQIIGNTLYVGGAFQNGADIAAADFLVACDLTTGAASSTVANDGDFNSGISALTADSNGTLYAGGGFINLTGIPAADHVASYDGTWHAMGSGPGPGGGAVDSFVRSLTAHGTDVYVGTDAVDIAGIAQADHIARWDAQSQSFSALGSNRAGTGGWFDSFAFLNGMATYGSLIFVAGSFQNPDGHATADDVAYFDGSTWHPLGSDGSGNGPVNSQVNALAVFSGSLLAGGNFTSAGGDSHASSIAGHALRLPDAAVGGAKGGPFTGNNVYSATGAGEVRHVTVTRGKQDASFVSIQNDGPVAAIFHVEGLGGAHGVKAHWFAGQKNITSAVVNGTYDTAKIDAGDDVVLKVVVDVARSSAHSATVTTRVSASGAPVDGVRIQVRAKG